MIQDNQLIRASFRYLKQSFWSNPLLMQTLENPYTSSAVRIDSTPSMRMWIVGKYAISIQGIQSARPSLWYINVFADQDYLSAHFLKSIKYFAGGTDTPFLMHVQIARMSYFIQDTKSARLFWRYLVPRSLSVLLRTFVSCQDFFPGRTDFNLSTHVQSV